MELRIKRALFHVLQAVVAVLFSVVSAFFLFLPFPQKTSVRAVVYECVWQDGAKTQESYLSAYQNLAGVENGDILLVRDGKRGKISNPAVKEAAQILQSGDFGELFIYNFFNVKGIGKAALFRAYGNTLYYCNGEYYSFTGSGIKRGERTGANKLTLLSGAITNGSVVKSGAREIYLHKEASISYKTLLGARVQRIEAEAPYYSDGAALYCKTAGGARLMAAVPVLSDLTVKNVPFIDCGALLPCKGLVSLTLPYLGAVRDGGSIATSLFAWLFSDGTEFFVPETLKTVSVTGGKIADHAFYACPCVEEINACGVKSENISVRAFVDCLLLKTLHAPRGDLILPFAEFEKTAAPCGCTVYERSSDL